MEGEVESRLTGLHDDIVPNLPDDLDLDQLMRGYHAMKPGASVDDLTMACIEYAIRCTYPELFGEVGEPPIPEQDAKEAKAAPPVPDVD